MVLLTADTWVREDPGSAGKEQPGLFLQEEESR